MQVHIDPVTCSPGWEVHEDIYLSNTVQINKYAVFDSLRGGITL